MKITQWFILLLQLIFCFQSHAQESNHDSLVVLELFTSQGCSSCPAADDLLHDMYDKYSNKEQTVLALSYHVDYWNRLGWKDPFSTAMFSDYQREYAIQFNSESIYTPQLVVNGLVHVVGSHKTRVEEEIEKKSKVRVTNSITCNNIQRKEDTIAIQYKITGNVQFDRITWVLIVDERITSIPRGENRDRTLINNHIVANRIVTAVRDGEVLLRIPDWITRDDQLSIMGYAQDKTLGITGAVTKSL